MKMESFYMIYKRISYFLLYYIPSYLECIICALCSHIRWVFLVRICQKYTPFPYPSKKMGASHPFLLRTDLKIIL